MIALYQNIKKRRTELQLTQSELAERMGYAEKSMIAKIEKGLVDLPQSKIIAFANALNTSASALMGWDEEAPRYYFDEATAEKAQELYDNPGMRILFDAARDSRPEDLQMAADLLNRLKETNKDG